MSAVDLAPADTGRNRPRWPALDARLLPPAAAAWAAAGLVRWVLGLVDGLGERAVAAERAAAAFGVLLVLGAAVVGTFALRALLFRSSPVPGAVPGSSSMLRIAAVTSAAAVVAAWSAALSVSTSSPAPVATWAEERATATVGGVVAGAPRIVTGPRSWQEPQAQLRLATSTVAARGEVVAVDLPLVLRLDVDDVPPPGAWVEAVGRLGPAPPGTDAAVGLSAARWRVTGEPGWLDTWTQAMRAGLNDALAGVPRQVGSLVAGLAIGDDADQPAELADAMRASGLAHLTAVSGGNIAILLGVVIGVARAVRASLRARTTVSVAALGVFTVLVGPQPSVLRAVAMGLIATVGVLVGGRRGSVSVLGAGVLLLVVVAPWLATSWGFALSALATAGIVLLAPVLAGRLARARWSRRWPLAVREAVALTAAAQLGTLPVLVAMGGAVGWVALPANLLAAPLVVPVTILGLATAVIAPVLPGVAVASAHAAAFPAAGIAWIAHTAAAAPAAGFPWPTGWAGLAALCGVVAAVVVVRRSARRMGWPVPGRGTRRLLLAAGAVVGGILLLWPPGDRGWPPDGWRVLMCDVGQGDALLLRAGEGSAVVVDTGPDPAAVDRCLSDAGIVNIPAVVLTHFHADHVGGLAGVLRGRSVGRVLVTPVRDPAQAAVDIDATLAAVGLHAEPVAAGDRRRAGDVEWETLWPRRRIAAGSVANNASVVLAADIDGLRVLLTGDIEPEAQTAIAGDLRARRFDVVKVPHHGSADVAAELTTWAPARIALVSVGAGNDYGHPAPSTVGAWVAAGALVARTDESGDVAVVVVADGPGIVSRR